MSNVTWRFAVSRTALQLTVLAALLCSVVGSGCGGAESQPPESALAVTGVSVSPSSITLFPGGTQQFAATVSPSDASQSVIWAVSGEGCPGEACGTIDATGLYTAPMTPSNPATVNVRATSTASPAMSGWASVSIRLTSPDNSKLNGQYAVWCIGGDAGGPNYGDVDFMAIAGSVTADGTGRITGGVLDISLPEGLRSSQTLLAEASTYSVNPQGGLLTEDVGVMTLVTAEGAPTENFALEFSFSLDTISGSAVASRGRLIPKSGGMACTGGLARQDPAAFSTAVIAGGYAFGFSGVQGGPYEGAALVAAGRFTADGGSLRDGQVDVHKAGLVGTSGPSFAGAYSVGANGRGTATLNIPGQPFFNFSFYVVSPEELLFLEADPRTSPDSSALSGWALRQSGGPFASASLNGPTVIHWAGGSFYDGASLAVGQLVFDGVGNAGGTVVDDVAAGTYLVNNDGLGRGFLELSIGTTPVEAAFYLVGPNRGFVVSAPPTLQEGQGAPLFLGMFELQTGAPFSNASVSGAYVLGTLSVPGFAYPLSGCLVSSQEGSLEGWFDKFNLGTDFIGILTIDPVDADKGRALVMMDPMHPEEPTENLDFYFISPSRAVGIGLGGEALIVIEK